MSTRAPALRFAFFALILSAGSVVQAANIAVNNIELVTHGAVDPSSGLFMAGTFLNYELEFREATSYPLSCVSIS